MRAISLVWRLLTLGLVTSLSLSVAAAEAKWTKPSDAVIKQKLTPLQCSVTQDGATEKPFQNEFWDNKRPGIYVDIVSGEPLFSSLDKYDSGSGWPSFTKPLIPANVTSKPDNSLGIKRTEIRSKHAGSHLGHLFDDGPPPAGKRYCVNSASLRFIPVDKLESEGYGEFRSLFMSKEAKIPSVSPSSNQPRGDFAADISKGKAVATLAGGCFWGMEDILRGIKGVIKTQVGYTGGVLSNPTYDDVKTGKTGHAEAVQILFDPSVLSYDDLLVYFFRMHDPTTMNRQGNDIGTQYRSVIFFYDDTQRQIAERRRDLVDKSGKWKKPVVTDIVKAGPFWKAEDYHQKYLEKNPGGYTCHFLRD